MKRIVSSMLGFALLLVSCGQDPQPDTTKPVVTLVSSKASVTAAESIKLTATATDNVGVTKVEFYDGVTKLGEDSSSPYEYDVALTATNNGSRSYKVKAFDAAGNEGSSDPVTVTVAIAQTITVTGTVINDRGFRVVGAKVLLNNGNLQTTDATGSFTYNAVASPYNLTVSYDSKVFVSNGLTRTDPLIFPFISFSRAPVIGSVIGPTYPLVAGDNVVIGSTGSLGGSVANSLDGRFNSGIQWSPLSSAITVDFVALRYTSLTGPNGSAGVITDFLKMGKRVGVALTSGITRSDLDITLDTPVAVSNATLTYSLGAYSSPTGGTAQLSSVTAGGAQFVFNFPISNGNTTKIPTEGASFSVRSNDNSGNSAFITVPAVVDGSTSINLPSETVVSNTIPMSDAINISKTPILSWRPLPEATAYVVFLGNSASQSPSPIYQVYLPGTSNSYAIPDIAAVNVGLQPGVRYTWQVFGVKGANFTPDTLTEPSQNTLLKLNSGLIRYEAYTSRGTSFTTAP